MSTETTTTRDATEFTEKGQGATPGELINAILYQTPQGRGLVIADAQIHLRGLRFEARDRGQRTNVLLTRADLTQADLDRIARAEV